MVEVVDTFNCKFLTTPPKRVFLINDNMTESTQRTLQEQPQKTLLSKYFLDRGDLTELALRMYSAGSTSHLSTGALSFPRSKIIGFPIESLIRVLQDLGRAKVVERIPKNPYGSRAGNVIVYPSDDESVMTTMKRINFSIIRQLVMFYLMHADAIESTQILPNTSTSGLKGLAIKLSPRTKERWQTVSDLQWSFGRGLMIAALPENLDVYAVIDCMDEYLRIAFELGQLSNGAIKYIQFLHDQNDKAYIALASGISLKERIYFNNRLSTLRGNREATDLIKNTSTAASIRRIASMRELSTKLGLRVELVTDSIYIDMDQEREVVVSGGLMTTTNGLAPFTLSNQGIIIHRPNQEGIVPIGTKLVKSTGFKPAVPAGVKPHFLEDLTGKLTLSDSESLFNGLRMVEELKVLALGYHDAWAIK